MVPSSFHQRRLYGASRRKRTGSRKRGYIAVPRASVPGVRSMLSRSMSLGKSCFHVCKNVLENRPTDGTGWVLLALQGGGAVASLLLLYLIFLWLTLPDIQDPRSLIASQSTVIVDRNGVELYRLFNEQDRTYIPADRIPDYLKHAAIAIEDERFYERGCLDIRAIARVVLHFGRAGGGSTLTRQLARNALNLQNENVYSRKLKEFMLGCQMERRFTKDELLELYLNWIPFGSNAYGVEQASKAYFGISAEELTLGQAAVLASLPQRPTYYSPYGTHVHTRVSEQVQEDVLAGRITKASEIDDNDVSIGLLGAVIGSGATTVYVGGRTDQVLQNMQEQGLITEQEHLVALETLESMTFQPSREDIRAPHFVLWVRDQVENMFAGTSEEGLLEQGGLRIETTLDWELQQIAEEVVAFHREDILNRFGAQNLAMVSVDVDTREILTYVGNMDYGDTEHGGKIDMVHAPRQPGSSFKPFVYAAAFLRGYTPATVLYDVPTKIGDDEPQNFDGKFMGPLTIRYALGASRNIPAAKAFFLGGGEESILALVSNMGADTPHRRRQELANERADGFDYGWPLALGAAETPLYEMVQAFSTFAGAGVYKPLIAIHKITDKHGNLLFESQQEKKEVLDPRIAYQITSILSDEQARPEAYWKSQLTVPGYETAAKTGTSNKCLERDEKSGNCKLLKPDNAWLLGYTPELVTGVWAGNADSSAMFDRGGGLNTASPVWKDFMVRAHRKIQSPKTKFTVPDDIVRPQISLLSGQFPTECTPVNSRRSDVFLRENSPKLQDPACKQLTIDKVTRLLASDSCPKEAQESGSFLVATSIMPGRWPDWEEGVQKWVKGQMELWYASPNHSGAIIPLPVAPTEVCDISLTPGRAQKPEVSILFPPEGGTATYPSFKPRVRYEVGSGISEVLYHVDGKRIRQETDAPFFESAMRMPRSIKESGMHEFSVTLTDEYFNTVKDTVHFRFDEDSMGPAVNITAPRDGISVPEGAEITVQADARDVNGAIKYVQFYLDDVLLTTKPSVPYEFSYTLKAAPGVHILRAEAEDMAKNIATDEIRIVVGDEGGSTEPVLLSPPRSMELIQVGDIVDIRVFTPPVDLLSPANLKVIVRSDKGQDEALLLDISDGAGTFVRPWKAHAPGYFSILLVSENPDGTEKEWDAVGVFEVR